MQGKQTGQLLVRTAASVWTLFFFFLVAKTMWSALMKRATNKLYWDYDGKSTDGTARKREAGVDWGKKERGETRGDRYGEFYPKLDRLSKHELWDLLSPSKNNPKTIKTSVLWAHLILRISHRSNIERGFSRESESRTIFFFFFFNVSSS